MPEVIGRANKCALGVSENPILDDAAGTDVVINLPRAGVEQRGSLPVVNVLRLCEIGGVAVNLVNQISADRAGSVDAGVFGSLASRPPKAASQIAIVSTRIHRIVVRLCAVAE